MPSAAFEAASQASKQLESRPTDDELLQLYAYYKQANQQPPFESADKPGMFDFKAKYKYQAWEKIVKEGVSPTDAEKAYIDLVEKMKQKYGFNADKVPEAVGS